MFAIGLVRKMIKVDLYPHQLEAIEKLSSGSILCGGVGSGKSRAAIGYYIFKELDCRTSDDHSFDLPRKNIPLFIITTPKKRDSLEWEEELSKFCLSTNRRNSLCSMNVVVDSWNNIKKYEDIKDSFFIFDEQRVVGYGTWAKTFIKIAKSNDWVLLSATPGDTWMDYMPVFIANGFFKNKTDFVRKHVVYDRSVRFPKVSRYIDTDILERYRKRVLVNMPVKRSTERVYRTLESSFDKDLYKQTLKNRWDYFYNEPIPNPAALCYILRRIVNSDLDKCFWLDELVSKHSKIIVFYNYTYELYILRRFALDHGIPFGEYNGLKHEQIPEGENWLYFVQYTAGAEGWNCVLTDTIVFYSLNYSYKIMEQASGRIDRLNTDFDKLYYYALTTSSRIDKAIIECLKRKENFNAKGFGEQLIKG